MYRLELNQAPIYPIEKDKNSTGMYKGLFDCFDVNFIKRPFGNFPVPGFFFRFRARSTITLTCADENFISKTYLFGTHLFCFMESIFWEKSTGRKLSYRRLMPFFSFRSPVSLIDSSVLIQFPSRIVKIFYKLREHKIDTFLEFKGDAVRPDVKASFYMDTQRKEAAAVSFGRRWSLKKMFQASMKIFSPVSGSVIVNGETPVIHLFTPEKAVAFMDMRKGYYFLKTRIHVLTGLGFYEGKSLSFYFAGEWNFSEPQTVESGIFYDGKSYQLPPVKITRPFGITRNWIIQDTESLVDLVFVPAKDGNIHRNLSLFILRTDYHTVFGEFEGLLKTTKGDKFNLKAFPGTGTKKLLRM